MGINIISKGKSTHWCEVGIQEKDECSRRDREVQGVTHCEGMQTKGGNQL